MPKRTVPVRSHYRDTEHKRVRVKRHTRALDSRAPLQFNFEEVLGPRYSGPSNERCSKCRRFRPVAQRDLERKPLCGECAGNAIEDHELRQLELEQNERDQRKRDKEWSHYYR